MRNLADGTRMYLAYNSTKIHVHKPRIGLHMRANFHSGNWEIDICVDHCALADGIRALKRSAN